MSKELERKLAYHCAPAIFGIKSSNLINVSREEFPNIEEDIEEINREENRRVSFKILYKGPKSVLLLVFREDILIRQLSNERNHEFLVDKGYPMGITLESYFDYLSYRIENSDTFPHEIGVFLGYDLDDIIDFQEGKKKCLHVGYWKVYSNAEIKFKKFDQFTRCKKAAMSLVEKGIGLEKIMIAR